MTDTQKTKLPHDEREDKKPVEGVTRSGGMLRPSFRVALEPRVMFDAAAMATAADVVTDTVPQTAPPIVPEVEAAEVKPDTVVAADSPETTADAENTDVVAATSETDDEAPSNVDALAPSDDDASTDVDPPVSADTESDETITSIVFVDVDVENPDLLVNEIVENLELAESDEADDATTAAQNGPEQNESKRSNDGDASEVSADADTDSRTRVVGNTLVVLLGADTDSIHSVTETISAYENIEAIHFVTHGDEDLVRLGDTWLGSSNVDDYGEAISSWGDSLTADADILFYGCDLAADENGRAFINSLGELSGADVAASTDTTGSSEFGGNWALEYSLGSVQTHSIVGMDAHFGWRGQLNFYTVTNTDSSGSGSLNWAITNGNANAGPHEIRFAISETDANHLYYVDDGVSGQVTATNIATTTELVDSNNLDIDPDHASSWFRIDVGTGLPSIDFEVTFRGEFQSQFVDRPVIEIHGPSSTLDGLVLTSNADQSEIRNIAINSFSGDGLVIHGDNVDVTGSHIGTDVSGLLALGNGGDGIQINGDFNTIGGTSAADRNVISGNGDDGIAFFNAFNTSVEGNYIGINSTGDAAIANGNDGIDVLGGANNEIINNVLSGNRDAGLELDTTTDATVSGNLIGTDATGQLAVGNEVRGILVEQATDILIGGSGAGEGNVISGNWSSGIVLGADSSEVEGNYIGTDIDGDTALGNGLHGVLIDGDDNTVGGSTASHGNVVSANDGVGVLVMAGSEDNSVAFNHIGTDAAGTADLGNTDQGVFVDRADHNVIVDNLISGNGADGVVISESDHIDIGRNTVGLDTTGAVAIANDVDGISISEAVDVDVFDNVVSGNADDGIQLNDVTRFSIEGNTVGLDATRSSAVGNGDEGIVGDDITDGSIGGPAAGQGNVVSANADDGIWLRGNDLTVAGNLVGTDGTGAVGLGNGGHGIHIEGDDNLIGGPTLSASNVIGDNDLDGIFITGSDNTVQGNYIGTDKTENINLANRRGVAIIGDNINDNLIGGTNSGEGNIIANNRSDGIGVFGLNNTGHSILGNLIYDQNDTAIDLNLDFVTANDGADADGGANDSQNFPEITLAETDGTGFVYVEATLESTPLTDFRIEFFSTDTADSLGHGEAEQYIGAQVVSTDASGIATFTFSNSSSTVALGSFITATATVQAGAAYGSTSELAANRVTTAYSHAPVITTAGGSPTLNHIYLENGTLSTTVTATDATPGDVLTWSLETNQDYQLFTINPVTGELSFNSPPDFEAVMAATGDNKYFVNVVVEDLAGATDTQQHVFNIVDADEAPEVTSNGAASSAAITVNEGTSSVTALTASDQDIGDSIVSYTIVGGTDAGAFQIDASNNLVFATAPDFDNPTDTNVDNVYEVVVEVEDTTGLIDSQVITVTVDNVDNAPDIISDGGNPVSTIYTQEGSTAVTTVVASDADLPGDTLEYSLAGGADAALFEIDLFSGDLKFKSPPNFEVPVDADFNGIYEVRVEVEDSTGLTDFQVISVVVTDVNEDPDVTSGSNYSVNEGTTNVGMMSAADPDLPGDNISYAISGADSAAFNIDTATGELTFVIPPDYEAAIDGNANNVYELVLTVSDGNGGFDVKTIYVTVNNLDDTPPVVEETPTEEPEDPEIPDPTPPEDPETGDPDSQTPDISVTSNQQTSDARDAGDSEIQVVETQIAEFNVTRSEAIVQINQLIETLQERLQEDGGLPALAGFDRTPLSLSLINLQTELLDVDYSRSLLSLDMQPAELSRALLSALDSVLEQLADPTTKIAHGQIFSNAAIGLTVSVSVGYVGWLLRFGYLIAGFLSVGTTLRTFDPLPVLAGAKATKKSRDAADDDNESGDQVIERMFEQS